MKEHISFIINSKDHDPPLIIGPWKYVSSTLTEITSFYTSCMQRV